MSKEKEQIKEFWDKRAREHGEDWRATLGEKYLRLLEIQTVVDQITICRPSTVMDVGCGNGYSTKEFALRFPQSTFVGVDFSEEMISQAQKKHPDNASFQVSDVTDDSTLPKGPFDLIVTQRCLQNLPTYELQKKAIESLLSRKSENGILFLMECSKNGVAQLNRLRKRLGKKPKDNIEPWHNNFFVDEKITADFNAEIHHFCSTYMFFSKVISNRLAKYAYRLPQIGSFGYDKVYLIR